MKARKLAFLGCITFTAACITVPHKRLAAQTVIQIPDNPRCTTCTIELRPMTSLSPPEERGLFQTFPRPSVARLANGSLVAGPLSGDSVLAVFGASGKLIHAYGRVGEGPNEFTTPIMPKYIRVSPKGDAIYVLDGSYLHRLDPKLTKTFSKSLMQLRAQDVAVLASGVYVQWPVAGIAGRGTPIQVLSENGAVKTGIGITSARPMEFTTFGTYRKLSRSQDGLSVWSSFINRFELSRFDASGREQVRLVRDAKWFPPFEKEVPGEGFTVPLRPRVDGVLDGKDGLLWIAVIRGDAKFNPVKPGKGHGSEVRIDPYVDLNQYFDTTIEAIDVNSGKVVARHTFDAYLSFVDTADGQVLLYTVRPNAAEEMVVDVFTARVVGSNALGKR